MVTYTEHEGEIKVVDRCHDCGRRVRGDGVDTELDDIGRAYYKVIFEHCGSTWTYSDYTLGGTYQGTVDEIKVDGEKMAFIFRNRTQRGRDPAPARPRLVSPKVSKVPPAYSAIEEAFTEAMRNAKSSQKRALRGMLMQYPVGRYRIDYAIPGIMFGIELDGFRSHSSTADIANDRYRERQLYRAGWTIIRFGGLEIYQSVSQCVVEAAELADAHRARYRRNRWQR